MDIVGFEPTTDPYLLRPYRCTPVCFYATCLYLSIPLLYTYLKLLTVYIPHFYCFANLDKKNKNALFISSPDQVLDFMSALKSMLPCMSLGNFIFFFLVFTIHTQPLYFILYVPCRNRTYIFPLGGEYNILYTNGTKCRH